jgi:diguanylate cyclase (GGDEF)-like protein/PAS domain S-box-containing protein
VIHSLRAAVVAATLFLVAFVAWVGLDIGGRTATTDFDNFATIVAAAFGAWMCFRAASSGRERRGFWMLLGSAMAAWTVGESLWCFYEVIGGAVPFPSWADAGYLAAVPLAGAALLAHPAAALQSVHRVVALLDGLIVTSSVFFLSWYLVLGPTIRAGGQSIPETLVGVAYPVGDVVLVVLVVIVLMRGTSYTQRSLVLVMGGLVAMALADTAYLYLTQVSGYATGLIDAGWVVAYLLIALGAVDAASRSGGNAAVSLPPWRTRRLALVYTPLGLAFGVAAWAGFSADTFDPVLWVAGLFAIGLVIGRQVLVLRENANLTDELEARVAARTMELFRREEHFRSLVEQSSDLVMLLDPDGTVTYASESSERILSRPVTNLVGHRLVDLVHDDDRFGIEALLLNARASPRAIVSAEWRMARADGEWRWLEGLLTNRMRDDAVTGLVLNSRDVTERRALEEELRQHSLHDALTGLANGVLFHDRVAHSLERRQHDRGGPAVVTINLEHFKNVNDTAGHEAGDRVLREVARRLAATARAGDTVARLGGDEFAILLESIESDDQVTAIVDRVLTQISEPLPGEGLRVIASAGIALRGTQVDVTVDQLLRQADVAMHVARTESGQHSRIFEPEMHESLLRRLELEARLPTALERGEFVVFYQPVVDLATRQIRSLEALVRWQHPERGLVPPGEFIPAAERSGIIVPLGEWVLRAACVQTAAWQHDHPGLRVAVNVVVQQVRETSFSSVVADALASAHLEPHLLTLEITESSMLEPGLEGALDRLRALGVSLAIDDFGTGYSSLSYLTRLPVQTLKIDRSFLFDATGAPAPSTLLEGIVSLAHNLHLEIVVEGIEDEATARLVEDLGCEKGQGYHFARPGSASDVTRLLDAWVAGRPPALWKERIS